MTAPVSAILRTRSVNSHAVVLWLLPAGVYYAFLLCAGSSGLFAPVNQGLTFNSMLVHLLHGHFDVDAATIGDEGYLYHGAVNAYFGVFPALFRGLFLWVPDFAQIDFTRLCCLIAVGTMACFKALSARLMWRQAGEPRTQALLLLMTAAILFGGAQIQFLRPTIFQEVALWAGAFAAGFVYLVLRGLVGDEGFTARLLTGMAFFAGLALLTRVSTACGLYAAFGFVWLRVAWRRLHRPTDMRTADVTPLIGAAAIATVFILITALVNIERWGNPLVFMPLNRALMLSRYPERLARLHTYGEFNPGRLGYSLLYYFLPLWVLHDGNGQLWWGDFGGRLYDGVELPPSSFFVSDPLLIGLAVYGAIVVWRYWDKARRAFALLSGLGLFIPCGLILTELYLCFRYRMEFYPFLELFAFLGFGALVATPGRRTQMFVVTGALVSVVAAHAMWVLYMLSPPGPVERVLGPLGVVDFYKSLFH
jgi:hypothetical protein